ncbi:hypothetical protein A2678_00660 [Candidatus Kaiserbacteria bacterium RIFCSPHIGHO2_01_FULL_53_31]|uniref:Uncharacterized protein n=1 Tax=Candidatus Kaiserbacteria bacterium RIFCSPHIGHO2_01_FULL_53_31 TaxID=1798481 RepID=A0A1F6CJ35_9BACT|nr:MAG: hypothetical protein A2678_00660 [Candidatus Kaiserbacteria bacterium RIFCSPHIGHO2_01_FULL_53_31]
MISFIVALFVQDKVVLAPGQDKQLAIIATLFAGCTYLIVVPLIWHAATLQWRQDDRLVTDVKTVFLTQDVVDARVSRLAAEFKVLCESEVRLQGTDMADGNLDALKCRIAEAKHAFWTTRELAERMGFRVYSTVNAYF